MKLKRNSTLDTGTPALQEPLRSGNLILMTNQE
jgi:hypothetical protein